MCRLTSLILFTALVFSSCGLRADPGRAVETSNQDTLAYQTPLNVSSEAININTAGLGELQRIPYIGPTVAIKVIEHREKHGPFKRPEELMLVQGISDLRFRRIRHLIRVE